MQLAILVTNTDDSAFADAHPRDGEKFAAVIQGARPGWRTAAFEVRHGEFPQDLGAFDGAIITGSPASVRSGQPWVTTLSGLIRDMAARRQPLFGACFGHQAVAAALGGAIGNNPDGLVHGLTHNRITARPGWMQDLPEDLRLYGSHYECVTALPEKAALTAVSNGAIAGFAVGTHVWTTQHHPEMSRGFFAALTEEMLRAGQLSPAQHARALASLETPADQPAFAEALARFFEQARQ